MATLGDAGTGPVRNISWELAGISVPSLCVTQPWPSWASPQHGDGRAADPTLLGLGPRGRKQKPQPLKQNLGAQAPLSPQQQGLNQPQTRQVVRIQEATGTEERDMIHSHLSAQNPWYPGP